VADDAAPHSEGHELLIASLLDRDLPEADRVRAERLVASCSGCAAVYADLRSLAAAARVQPAPARPRDFRLTADDAARLRSGVTLEGEPLADTSRLTGEMQPPTSDHRLHDQLLIANLLDRSVDARDHEPAEALVASCVDCAGLYRDLVTIRDAARALPTPPRPRDYAISVDQARRLRLTGWRRLVTAFGSSRDIFSRPLAIGLTTIGLAGLLVTTIPGVLPGGTPTALPALGQAGGGAGANSQSLEGVSLAPVPSAGPEASAAGPAAAAVTVPTAEPSPAARAPQPTAEAEPSGEAFDTYSGTAVESPAAAALGPSSAAPNERQGADRSATALDGQPASVDRFAATGLAGLLLLVGVGLFTLRWAARRL
jgi:hypothetical protein